MGMTAEQHKIYRDREKRMAEKLERSDSIWVLYIALLALLLTGAYMVSQSLSTSIMIENVQKKKPPIP